MAEKTHDLLTMTEVAKRLRVTSDRRRRKALHSALRKLGIVPIEVTVGDWRVRRADLEAALAGAKP